MKKLFLILAVPCILTNLVRAHGDVHERIVALSNEIKTHPDSADLYRLRGELYYQYGHYNRAIRDLKCCARRGGKSKRLQYNFAQSYHKKGKNGKALRYLDQILKVESRDVKALRLKGKVLMDKGSYCKAAQYLEQVIETAKETNTENYLEAAAAWEKCTEAGSTKKAITIIEKGMDDLGPLLAFFNRLKDIALRQQDFEEAIKQQTNLINYSIRKENPYYQRALLFLKIHDEKSAREDLILSQKLLNQLPIRFQKMEAMRCLRQQIEWSMLSLNRRN